MTTRSRTSGSIIRENWISNRVFTSYTDILDHCCAAWNKLTDQPWTIMSIGLRDWAHQVLISGTWYKRLVSNYLSLCA